MSDYITTYSGTHFVPTKPDASTIHITDIAHALSLICRGNGHVKTFFSVGQHCINCAREAKARGLSARIVLACLLHDASESYMSDVPRPFKQYLDKYLEFEEQLLDVIYTKYLGSALSNEEKAAVKQIDDDMLYFDLRELLNESSDREEPQMKTTFSYEVLPFGMVESEYLSLYYMCKADLDFENVRKKAKIMSKAVIKRHIENSECNYRKSAEYGNADAGGCLEALKAYKSRLSFYRLEAKLQEL